jgi:hypothetical protein
MQINPKMMHITFEHIGQQRLRKNHHQIFENIGRLVQQTLWLENSAQFLGSIVIFSTLGPIGVVDFESLHLELIGT